jgi:YD repeat-containing protein
MKKSIPVLQTAAVCIIIIILLPGCNKIDSTATSTNGEVVPCQVQQMVYPPLTLEDLARARARIVMQLGPDAAAPVPPSGENDTAIFTYNTLGNPVSIIHQRNIGNDNIFFKYDNANRLTNFIVQYADAQGGDQWHRYSYDPHNTTRIIADTDYVSYVTDNGTIIYYDHTELTTFVYDAQNRISKTTETVLGDTIVTTYTYDSHGNLETGGAVYDKKVNVHRTNKLWMFLDRDYSVNNPVDNGTYTYNQGNLPITIAIPPGGRVAGFYFMVIGYPNGMANVSIDYSCSVL